MATTIIRRLHRSVIRPTGRTITLGARLHVLIWTRYFDAAWDSIPLHEKLAWILFITNTLAILTLFQLLALV